MNRKANRKSKDERVVTAGLFVVSAILWSLWVASTPTDPYQVAARNVAIVAFCFNPFVIGISIAILLGIMLFLWRR